MPRIHQINVGGTSYSIVDSSNIATLEYGPNASVPYAKNDYVIWMDQLYKVIAPIAINAPFIINTNIKSTTVSEELHSGGHMILDDQGEIMDQRQNLQFPGMTVEDSEVGNKTVVRGYVRYETMEEAEEHADDIQDWARVIVDEADYVGVIDDHLDAESPNPVKNSVVTGALEYKRGDTLTLTDGVSFGWLGFYAISSKYLYVSIQLTKGIITTPTVSPTSGGTLTVHDNAGRVVMQNSDLNFSVESDNDRLILTITKKDGTAFLNSSSQTAINQAMVMVQPSVNITF